MAGSAWQPQVDELARAYETLVFDNRGVGGSVPLRGEVTIEAMAADARALMDHAGWRSAHVVGHSMGGLIAQQLALDDPGRVRSLTLLCTFDRGRSAARITPWVLWMSVRVWVGTARMRRQAYLEMLFPAEVLRADHPGALASRVERLIGRDLSRQPPILMRQLGAMRRHDVSARLGELRGIPTWVLSADRDRIARPEYGRRLASLIPGARFERMENASHGMTIHKAEAVNRGLRAFVDSCERNGFNLPSCVRGGCG